MSNDNPGSSDSWLNSGKGGRPIRADAPPSPGPASPPQPKPVTPAVDPLLPRQSHEPEGRRSRTGWIVGVVAAVLVLAFVGVLVSRNSQVGGSTASNGGGEPIQSFAGTSGVWYGSADLGSGTDYKMTLALETDDDEQVQGIVRMRSENSGKSGTWHVRGTAAGSDVMVEPGAWIGKSEGWTRDGFTLNLDDTGGLSGTATGYNDSDVALDQISSGEVTLETVRQDPRAALVASEERALGYLQEMRGETMDQRDSLNYEWVPQVGSGCAGLWTSLGQLTAGSLLSSSASMATDHGAITVAWEDVGVDASEACPSETMWVILVPEGFESAGGAKRWCREAGFSGGQCAARYLVPRGERGTQIEYL